jgi:glycosyltransferase involved in cell wall biosynthesis
MKGLRAVIVPNARATVTGDLLARRYLNGDSGEDHFVAYSFWCDYAATGIALAKQKFSNLVAVSRAHGADLYLERHDPPFLASRVFTLSSLDTVFADSTRGADYLNERYPGQAPVRVARMGVHEPGFLSRGSQPGHVSVFSCSVITPIKRIPLIAEGVHAAATMRPDLSFEWHHFGDGESREEVLGAIRSSLPGNAVAHFPGYPGHSGLMTYYKDHPVDVFVNASVSEGTPVAIMEAASVGIPIVATSVGGNTEIVDGRNGVLVSPDPSPDELGRAIIAVSDPRVAPDLRQGSRLTWKSNYDAAANLRDFANEIATLQPRVHGLDVV